MERAARLRLQAVQMMRRFKAIGENACNSVLHSMASLGAHLVRAAEAAKTFGEVVSDVFLYGQRAEFCRLIRSVIVKRSIAEELYPIPVRWGPPESDPATDIRRARDFWKERR